MSVSLEIYLKSKTTNDKLVTLLYLSTTPARNLTSEVIIPCGKRTQMTPELWNEITSFYNQEITNTKNMLTKRENDLNRLYSLLAQASSSIAYENISSSLTTMDNFIEESKKDLEELEIISNKLKSIDYILLLNELSYSDLEIDYG